MSECPYGELTLISSSISLSFGPLGPVLGPLPMFWAHSCRQPLNHSLPDHPQIGQRKHHQQLTGVLGQTPVTRLAMPELTLDHPKRMLHLGTDTGLDLFNPICQSVAGFGLVQRLALARHHGNFPVHASVFVLNLLALFNASVARVGKDHFFLSMQQGMCLRNIVGIGRRCRDRMHQARVSVHANVRLHAKVPLVALLGLVHLRVALAFVVLGGAGRCNQGGIHHRACLEHQPAINQFGIDSRQYLRAQVVLLEHVSKAQDGAFIRQSGDARIELGKLAVQRDVMQCLFHGRVGMPKELLQQMNAQHHLSGKRWAPRLASRCMRRNQGQQLRPRNHQVHLIQKLTLARALGDKFESGGGKANLFHLCLTHETLNWVTFADFPLLLKELFDMKKSTFLFSLICFFSSVWAHPQDGMNPEQLMRHYPKVFNEQDMSALEEVYHFPHVRLVSGQLTRFEDKSTPVVDFVGLKKSGWHHSRVNQIKVFAEGANSAMVELDFSRFDKDDKEYYRSVGYYVLTKNKGYWQILSLNNIGQVAGMTK